MTYHSGRLEVLVSSVILLIRNIYISTDELDEAVVQGISEAAEKEQEKSVSSGIMKRKGKSRRSMVLRFPPEWANSREAFRKSERQFEFQKCSASSQRNVTELNLNTDRSPIQPKQGTGLSR
ncbi:BgTH12-04812 [Blumeria graminis f. sp. triticale]|uniref:Bgt-51779 n=2 Tax=Blumeria graminis TaxID=34373 RepID=A0A9X9L8M5_BLUGR|nr:BgTH12-04812 [Blumeria graminis f. sp. triticale]VCU39274.1 Bgt-51779 [Blumeria graminis f. sp. tritici]